MNLAIEIAVQLIEKAIDATVRIIEASAEHTAEERTAAVASIRARLDAKLVSVAAVKFKDAPPA